MKPARFDYHDPTEVDAAVDLLARYGGDAKVLAGGQSLVPLLNMRLAQASVLVDINRIAALAYVEEVNGALAVGALTRQRAIERSDVVARCCPLLGHAVQWVGHVQTRNRGTVGGSIAHNDPSAELVTIALLMDAEMVIQSSGGRRSVGARDFFTGPLTTCLLPGELLTEVRFPQLSAGAGWAFTEVARRSGDFALASAAAVLCLDDAGRVNQARIALGGVGATAVRPEAAEAALKGLPPGEAAFAEAAESAARDLDPPSDMHASGEFRRHLATVAARRALGDAWTRLKGGRDAA